MTEPEPLADPASGPAPAGDAEAARGVLAGQLAMLGRLAEAGLNLALAIEQQATAAQAEAAPEASETPEAPDAAAARLGALALAYGRVSRAVRLSVALQGRVLKEMQGLDEVAARMRRGELADAARAQAVRAAQRRGRVERIVGRVIAEAFEDQEQADRVAEEAWDRLDHDDIYGDLTRKPVSELIARICQDLGLSPDWPRLAEQAWAQEEMAGGAAGAPLARLRGLDPPGAAPAAADLQAQDLQDLEPPAGPPSLNSG